MLIILVAKDYFAIIFTDSKDLQIAVSKLAILLAVTMVLNSVQPVIGGTIGFGNKTPMIHSPASPSYDFYAILLGVAIGGGWQALVAYINIGCYYIFGLPLGFLLGYKANLGVKVR